MRILIACEYSGTLREAFHALGHDAWSCDLLPTETPGQHFQGDVRDYLHGGWDMMIAHPPCQYLSAAGARHWKHNIDQQLAAAQFVRDLAAAPIPQIAIENPRGALSRLWRKPDQEVNPWQFGDPYAKRTCLWLQNVPPLLDTVVCVERREFVLAVPGHKHRAKARARTFPGMARAMAMQWSG